MKRLFRRLLLGVLLVFGAAVLAFGLLAWQVDRLGQRDEARASDVIVVLGARVTAEGRPGSDLTSRTLHAVDLWGAGYAPNIICSGGVQDEPLSAASVCRQYAVELGVPPDRVWIADGSSNTLEDAQATALVMANQGWRSGIVVSHPLHVYRARWAFRQAGIETVASPTTTETNRIFLPLRAWYAIREAGAIVVTFMEGQGWFSPEWKAGLQSLYSKLP